MRRSNRGAPVTKCSAPLLISRRQAGIAILGAMLGGLAAGRLRADTIVLPGQTPAQARPVSVKLFTPLGAGNRDGSDWRNAMPIGALSKALARAQPGSGFFIGFDAAGGEPAALDRNQIILKASGDKGNPLFVQAGLISGSDGISAVSQHDAPFFKSSRPWSLADFNKRGSARCHIAIGDGASHLRLSGFRMDGASADGFFKFRGKQENPAVYEDIVISGIDARNVGRVVETERGAMLRNLTIADCHAVGIVRSFARFRHLSESALRNLDLDADHMDAGGKNVCQLISLEAGDNVLFDHVTLRNALNEPPPRSGKEPGYVQGDGIVCERKTRNVVIRNCRASGMGDGGFDLKTTDALIEDSSTDSCKFGARIWSESDNVIRRCSFSNPQSRGSTKGACIQAAGRLQIIDTKLHAGPGTSAIALHKLAKGNAPMVVMQGGSIQLDGDGAVVASSSLGVLELRNVAVNGVATDHRYVFDEKNQ